MADKAELAKAIARVDSDIFDLRISLGNQKDALIKQGKRAAWNAERATLTKPLYNLLERRWALDLVKHAASDEALYNAKVIGILLPETIEGTLIAPANRLIKTDVMTPNGPMPKRTYDVFQFEESIPYAQPHELKSDAGKSGKGVLASSVEGGITHEDIEVHFRQKSAPGKQIAAEKELITEASKIPGSKIVIEGTDAVTGKIIRREVDPRGLNLSRFSTYTDLPDVLEIRKPDPADLVPAPAVGPASKKRAQSTKVKKKPVIPASDLAEEAEDAAGVSTAKKQATKRTANAKLTANRGVTAPSPNASVEAAEEAADEAVGKPRFKNKAVRPKAKVKTVPKPNRAITPPSPHAPTMEAPTAGIAAEESLAAEAISTVPVRALPTTPPKAALNTVALSEEVAVIAPVAPHFDAHAGAPKGKALLGLKISPKIKAIRGFVLTIAFDLFVGWLEGRRISAKIKELLEKNADKFTQVVNATETQEDFVKFRFGDNLEKGYQLYFHIKLTVTRRCSDGGCGTSGSISDIVFNEINLSRTKGSEFFPDPKEEKGWTGSEATAVFYQPIFEKGIPVHPATEDAADGDLTKFTETFVARKKQGIGDYTRDYFDDFAQYYKFFPDSQAGKLFLGFALDDYLNDITAVELARKPPNIMMESPHNLPLDEALKRIRWGLASRISLIVYFYEIVIYLRPEYAIYYLELYDVYFKELDDGYRKCDSGCHRMTGDRRIIHRLTADDFRPTRLGDFPSRLPASLSISRSR